MNNQSKPIEERHILQNNENVFEMKQEDAKIKLIGAIIFVIGGLLIGLGGVYFKDGGIPVESIKLVLSELPQFLNRAWPIIVLLTVVLTLIFVIGASISPIYFKLTSSSITMRTSLRKVFGNPDRVINFSSKDQLSWKVRVNRRYGTKTVLFRVNDGSKMNKINISDTAFGYFGVEKLLEWLEKHYPSQKI